MDVKYDEELVKDIQEIFIHKIVPDNFILVIHKYNRGVLTFEDIERLRKSTKIYASKDVNYELLLTMKKYKGWFEVILQVCNDPDVKQGDIAEAFETIRKELDKRWTRDHTKKKEIAMGLSDLSLTSESNQRTVTIGYQLSANEGLEADQGAVCMSSEDKGSNQLSQDNHSVSTQQSSWVGVIRKNDKPYCTVCLTALTSDTAADDHCKGKQHQKKLKEACLVSQDRHGAGITMGDISQAIYGMAKSPPACSEPNSGRNGISVSSGPTSDYKVTPASLKPLSCSDDGNLKELFTQSQGVTASQPSWGGLEMKNGSQYCGICDVSLTSKIVADAHCKGKPHERKLNRAFPMNQGVSESDITTVSDFSSSASNNAMPTSVELPGSSKTAVNSGQISGSKMITASFKLTFSNDEKSTSSDSNEATLASSGATKASSSSSGATKATAARSVPTKATPTCSIEATLVSPDSSHAFNAGSKPAPGSDEEYIVDDGHGKLKWTLCDVPVTSGDNGHLQGSKHKKKLEALKDHDDSDETPPELGPHGEIITYGEPTGKCFVCNAPLNSKESAKQHMESRRHINQCKKFKLPVKSTLA